MIIYNNYKTNQKQEGSFLKSIESKSKSSEVIYATHNLGQDDIISSSLYIREIENKLTTDQYLTASKREKVLKELAKLPDEIIVAKSLSLVSVDFLIKTDDGRSIFIEFNERQHRTLSVNRASFLCDIQLNRYQVPRYVQRLLKDIWRFQNVPNFKIVWFDWYMVNMDFDLDDLLFSNVKEFALDGKFTFSELLA